MVAEVDYEKCTLCGAFIDPICIDKCPTTAVRISDGKIEITEFLCEDCNECGFACPDKAITIKTITW